MPFNIPTFIYTTFRYYTERQVAVQYLKCLKTNDKYEVSCDIFHKLSSNENIHVFAANAWTSYHPVGVITDGPFKNIN